MPEFQRLTFRPKADDATIIEMVVADRDGDVVTETTYDFLKRTDNFFQVIPQNFQWAWWPINSLISGGSGPRGRTFGASNYYTPNPDDFVIDYQGGDAGGTSECALPAAVDHPYRVLIIRASGADYVNVFPEQTIPDTIEGSTYSQASPYVVYLGETLILLSDGDSDWRIVLHCKDAATFTADDVTLAKIGTPEVDTIQEYIDHTGSAGWHHGGEITASGTAGAVDIAAGAGFIRSGAGYTDPLYSFEWAAQTAVAITSDSTEYIFVDYNGGTPQIVVSADEYDEETNMILIGVAINEGGAIESCFSAGVRLQESIGQAGRFMRRVFGLSRDNRYGGLALGETGTRNITLTAGILWWGRTEYSIAALDTSGADRFDIYYRDNPSGWVKVASASQWPNTQYDDGSGALVTMTNNKWANLWFYIEPDGDLVMVYGRAEYNSELLASAEAAPATVPPRLQAMSVLAGRLTFQKSAATGTFTSAFTTTFAAASSARHTDLSNLDFSVAGHTGQLPVANGGTAGATATAGFNNLSPVTTRGDIIIRDATNNVRLAVGASGTVLKSDGTDPSWGLPTAYRLTQTYSHTAFQTAATTFKIADMFTIPSGAWVEKIMVKLNTAFTITGGTTYYFQVGINGAAESILLSPNIGSLADVFSGSYSDGDYCAYGSMNDAVEGAVAAGGGFDVNITANSDVNLSNSTAGSITVIAFIVQG